MLYLPALLLAAAVTNGACTGAAPSHAGKDVAPDVASADTPTPPQDTDPGKPDVVAPDVANDTVTAACKCGDGTCDKSCETAEACPIDCGTPACTAADVTACDDKNECTKDTCNDTGSCVHSSIAGPCNDGNACTSKDTCSGSQCQGGAALVCDDGNPCTNDACEPANGCAYVANSLPCSDDDVCTTGDACVLGECKSGAPTTCDDFNACTKDACQVGKGCANLADDATACTDGSECTTVDTCVGGECVGAAPLVCDDGEGCTLDGCDKNVGCTHSTIVGSCDDGDACTTGDLCSDDACVGGAVKDCDDVNPCTDDACVAATGCTHTANTLPCDDKDACTVGDVCAQSACMPGAVTSCADDNLCTTDACNKATGCGHVNNALPCTDGSACTVGDACKDAACLPGAPTVCDDGNVCTEDACDAASGCSNVNYAADCLDGDACTVADICSDGVCMAGVVTDCADNSDCTADVCDSTEGCGHLPINVPCSDGSICTTMDTCVGSVCVGSTPALCSDENPCTDDKCDPLDGCSHPPNSLPCQDDDACTSDDACKDATCQGGPPTLCDDNNTCTADSCYTIGGCVHLALDVTCSDSDACTTSDACSAESVCLGIAVTNCDDGNVCTDDSCDKAIGCQHAANVLSCDDLDVCSTKDDCSEGGCVGSAQLDCDDKNPCTDDSCSAVDGCVATANESPCEDGSVCTVSDVCQGGVCKAGTALPCDDNNVCTDDSCDAVDGCVLAANISPCNDDDACTTADKCGATVCHGGAAPNCDDGNACTVDSCVPATGCSSEVGFEGPCNDGNVCTTVDVCVAKACIGTAPKTCTDGKVCTFDKCDPVGGCNYPAAVYFSDDFSTDTKGWLMQGDWMIGPAQMSIPYPQYNGPSPQCPTCEMKTGGFPEPKTDHTPTNDNGVAGTLIGGYTLRELTPTYFMTSPVVDLSNAQGDVWLQYWHWINADYAGYMEEYTQVYDGTQWVEVENFATTPTAEDAWNLSQLNVTAYKNSSFQVRFAFGTVSTEALSMSGWTVDDVRLVPATTCTW